MAVTLQVAGGNGEQCLSRDIYRLGTQFDFMRLMAWWAPSVSCLSLSIAACRQQHGTPCRGRMNAGLRS